MCAGEHKIDMGHVMEKNDSMFIFQVFLINTYIGMLTPGATELFGGGRIPP